MIRELLCLIGWHQWLRSVHPFAMGWAHVKECDHCGTTVEWVEKR